MENELFERASVPKAYMKLALPVVLSMMVSLVYNMVDTYFIALTGKQELVAGVSLAAPIFTLMIAFGDIFGLGGSIKIFMNQSDIITNGAMMLRFQQLGMVFMAVTLVSTCVCQSVGSAAGAFVLSISRQGVLYAVLLIVLNGIFGYTGIVATQACADVLTAVIAAGIIRKVLGGMKNEIQYDHI